MPSIIGDGVLTKQDVDTLNTALAASGLGGGAIAVTTLVASSTSDLQGAVTADSTLAVTGAATFASTVAVTGVATFSNNVKFATGQVATLAALTTNGAVNPHNPATYVITKAGILADTLAAPTATTDDGVVITLISTTANAHTLTATGLFVDGAAHVNLATWSANAGGVLQLMAYNAKWYVQYASNVTMS